MSVSQREKIKQITKSFIGSNALEQAARDTGGVITRQQIWLYKSEGQLPKPETCTEIIKSPRATAEAKAWARKCLAVVLPDVTVTVSEPEQVS